MDALRTPVILALCAVAAAGCSGEPISPNPGGPPGQTVSCTQPAAVTLDVGGSGVFDPAAAGGCIQLPASAPGAEHLVIALATNGTETSAGVSTSYQLKSATPAAATAAAEFPESSAPDLVRALSPMLSSFGAPKSNAGFHALLRDRERLLSASPAVAAAFSLGATPVTAVPPVVGSTRTFKVCSSTNCNSFVDVAATAKYVGPKGAIYLDDTVPTGGYTQADIDSVGFLFDNHMYPIDTTAFGRESDLDANGVVVVLLTDQVNKLSPSCNSSGSVILGYFFGSDLVPGANGTNNGEVFYGLVPDPSNSACTISRTFTSRVLAPTFIHEFQHMISFNQHVRVRGGLSEDTWLNEGLSHFAEELGARLIPDALCYSTDCFTQYAFGDVDNAYEYLRDPEESYLVEPSSSTGTLEERGANWLFVRWLVDHFSGADSLGTGFTRALVGTTRVGAANVAATTGVAFSTLIPEWQMANYLDDLPGFTPANTRLQYRSWNFRTTYESLNSQAPSSYPVPYPLTPDSTRGNYVRRGTLRGGSGRHLRVIQAASSSAVTLQLTDSLGAALTATTAPRIGVVRVR